MFESQSRRNELRPASRRRGRRARVARPAPLGPDPSARTGPPRHGGRGSRGALRGQQVGRCAGGGRAASAADALAARGPLSAGARPRASPEAAPERGVALETIVSAPFAPPRARFMFDDARAAGRSRPAADQIPALGIIL